MLVGIDPGLSGGVVVVDKNGIITQMSVMPSAHALADLLESISPKHVYLEKGQSFPKQGIASAYNYGHHNGQIEGILIAFQIPHTLVRPAEWSRELHKGTKGADTKSRSIEAAARLFPEVNFLATERSSKPHIGLVEAALIAEYGRRKLALSVMALELLRGASKDEAG